MGDALSRSVAEDISTSGSELRGPQMHSFNVGDWVWHPVHRVKMQVVKVTPLGDLLCEYKDNNGEIKRLDFPSDVLQSWERHEAERRERSERFARNPPKVITSRTRYGGRAGR